MEPGGQKRDLLGLSATATCGHVLAPKGRQHKVLRGIPDPHWLSQPLTSAPKSGPYGDGRPVDFLLQGLGSEMGHGQEVAECVCWKRRSVGFLPSRFSVFLGQRNPPQPLPACLALQHPKQQPGRSAPLWLLFRGLSPVLQDKQMCLVEGIGRVGEGARRDPKRLTCCPLLVLTPVPKLGPMLLLPQHLTSPSHLP